MFPRIALAAAIVSLMAVTAPVSVLAAEKTSKEKCTEAVVDVQEMQKAGGVGPKTAAQIKGLIEVAEHLCEQGNFQYADSVLRVIRTMMASE